MNKWCGGMGYYAPFTFSPYFPVIDLVVRQRTANRRRNRGERFEGSAPLCPPVVTPPPRRRSLHGNRSESNWSINMYNVLTFSATLFSTPSEFVLFPDKVWANADEPRQIYFVYPLFIPGRFISPGNPFPISISGVVL